MVLKYMKTPAIISGRLFLYYNRCNLVSYSIATEKRDNEESIS